MVCELIDLPPHVVACAYNLLNVGCVVFRMMGINPKCVLLRVYSRLGLHEFLVSTKDSTSICIVILTFARVIGTEVVAWPA